MLGFSHSGPVLLGVGMNHTLRFDYMIAGFTFGENNCVKQVLHFSHCAELSLRPYDDCRFYHPALCSAKVICPILKFKLQDETLQFIKDLIYN